MAKKKSFRNKAHDVNSFSKAAILKSTKYEKHRDILEIILDDTKLYKTYEIDELLTKTRKEKVN